MKTLIAAIGAVLLLSACDSYVSSNLNDIVLNLSESGISGEVRMGPMNPVQSSGDESNYIAVEWDLEISPAGGGAAVDVRSLEDGTFAVPLSAGTYTVEAMQPRRESIQGFSSSSLTINAPIEVTVPEGEWVSVRIEIDTGIR